MCIRSCWSWWRPISVSRNGSSSVVVFSTIASDLCHLRKWLCEQGVAEVVMESTAQYWKPVWLELEGHMKLWLAQAQSNRAPRGRKSDYGDSERLVRRFVAGELHLSFVPEAEQRSGRSVTRARVQLACARVQLQNQLEKPAGRVPD